MGFLSKVFKKERKIEGYHHHILGEIALVQSPSAKRISIAVRKCGEVRLTYPYGRGVESKALAYLNSKMEWIVNARKRLEQRRAVTPQGLSPEQMTEHVESLRQRARLDLPQRIERLAGLMGLKYNRLTIRVARSRWGSCSGQNNISLSLFLMEIPEYLRDFVIIHELCHTIHHNHSVEFHTLVNHFVGGREAILSRELKKYSIQG